MYGGWCAGVVTGMIPLRVTLSNNLSVTAGAVTSHQCVALSPGPGWAHQHRILQESSVERQLVLPSWLVSVQRSVCGGGLISQTLRQPPVTKLYF